MAWSIDAIVIRPSEDNRVVTSNYSVQKILDASEEYISYYGANSQRRTLNFAMFENENGGTGLSDLEIKVKANANIALTSDQGAEGNFRILSLASARIQDHANTLPVYRCTAELIKAT